LEVPVTFATDLPIADIPDDVVQWLLDSDPALRWQVMRDLQSAPASVWRAERARVATEGLGAALLAMQDAAGTWNGVAWNHGWNSTMHVLMLLRDFGLDPLSDEAQRALARVNTSVAWQGDPLFEGRPFFTGEVEPCINGQVAAAGAYFGQDVSVIIDRLLTEQLPDGGWNCAAPEHSTRSSFNSTICVLEGLRAYEHATCATPAVTAARHRGEQYLLDRQLDRQLTTGTRILRDRKSGAAFQDFAFPTWWHYDLLRGLEYLRAAGVTPDARLHDAVACVAAKRDASGCWPLDAWYPGEMPVALEQTIGVRNRWITLRALRVLRWALSYDGPVT
jgi:hypothetical protein